MRERSTSQRDAATRFVVFAIGIAAACGLTPRPTKADEFLACGVPATRHLQMGSTDNYVPAVSQDLPVIADVIDVSGTIGLLQLTPLIFCEVGPSSPPCVSTCEGSIAFPASSTPLAVSDCIGSDTGDYTIEFNVVAQSTGNCGRPLACGIAPNDTALSVPGEVDPYTFVGIAGQQISLVTTATSDTTGSLRLRLFSPTGAALSDSCSGALTFNVPSNGTYTVLVSACVTPSTGPYTIVWQTLPACPAAGAPGFAYVTYANSGTVGVVDLTTNQTVSLIPLLPANRDTSSAPIATSPNSGFAYVTFAGSGTISIVNTTLNRVVGSIGVPASGSAEALHVAVDPGGRYAYVTASRVLDAVAVIDIATRKLDAIIRIDGIYGLIDGSAIAVSPDGKFVYVPAITSQEVRPPLQYKAALIVIDAATRTVVGRVTDQRFTNQFQDISFNPTATLAYVTFPDALYVVDTATRSVTQRLPLLLGDIAFSRDGRLAYATSCAGAGCDENVVVVIDMSTLTVTKTISLQAALAGGGTGGGVALSPDGGRLLVVNGDPSGQQPAVLVIDTATLQVIATIPAAGDGPSDVVIVTPPSGLCTADDSGQTRVTVGELVTSVNYSVDGCPTARKSGAAAQ